MDLTCNGYLSYSQFSHVYCQFDAGVRSHSMRGTLGERGGGGGGFRMPQSLGCMSGFHFSEYSDAQCIQIESMEFYAQ